MGDVQNKNLLRNKQVLEEISRHQWIESEKAGEDIGFEKASEDWLIRFSKTWMEYHLPKQKAPTIQKSETKTPRTSKTPIKRNLKKTAG